MTNHIQALTALISHKFVIWFIHNVISPMARYSSSSHVSFNRWLQLWDETGPTLTQRGTDDPNVPPLNFGVSHGDGECGLSNDGVYIIFPIFLGLYAAPVDVAMIPLPCVIDMVFFRKMAAFIAKIKEVTRIPSVAKHGPITWDYDVSSRPLPGGFLSEQMKGLSAASMKSGSISNATSGASGNRNRPS